MTKQEKINILVAQFEKYMFPRNAGETNIEYVERTVQERVAQFRTEFLENTIRQGISKADINVSEL